jgi:predicted phage-related endonuclease
MLQGSEEWYQARLGLVTASNMKLLLTPSGKVSENDKVRAFAYEIAAQRETQHCEESYISWEMERGMIEEDIARKIYSKNHNRVKECGFITKEFDHFTIGISPDGLIDDDGGIEIKSRKQKFQIQTIVSGDVPMEYMLQIQTSLMVTERKYWDFIQYSNGMPLFNCRVFPQPEMHEKILQAVVTFEAVVLLLREDYREKSKDLVKCERIDLLEQDELIQSSKENRSV